MSETDEPECAHNLVAPDPTRNDDGTFTDRWFCEKCEAEFIPAVAVERQRRELEFLLALADGGEITVNGMPWREVFDRINAIVADPV